MWDIMSVKRVTFKSKGAPYVISSAPSTTSIIVENTYSQMASGGSVSIGPSGCDLGRDSRTKEVECLWNSINP